jgi:thiopurine S-methyltransferase
MRWLLDQGYQVIGCDLSELGLQRFVQQNGLTANRKAENGVVTLSAPGVSLFAADFLNLTEQQVGRPGAFFDRAATIALPPDLRTAYARQVAALMPTDANGLLISVDYNQDEMKGPPFSVPDADIQALYAPHFSIDSLVSDPNSDFLEHLKKRGITALTETAYQLTRTS